MKLAELKSEFHRLIDETNDPQIIEQFFDAMTQSLRTEGSVWRSLTSDQQQSVIDAYEESKDADDLTTLDELKAKYAHWS
ncbi:hypothetical protein D0C36_06175 [Mucilaginibacter conchicola]|uniref:Uncharacterized protein n=1 Tax=Mucilaginibacter conchicola TaxID=2303333 RepID=A0A372NYZ1_9SPHI|nr:hypothetical protein [Mucilaginibacter conchicola]RFZ95111.1 hypothetical protein D0C36_06175 [Mucilaginibacter conchicola]